MDYQDPNRCKAKTIPLSHPADPFSVLECDRLANHPNSHTWLIEAAVPNAEIEGQRTSYVIRWYEREIP